MKLISPPCAREIASYARKIVYEIVAQSKMDKSLQYQGNYCKYFTNVENLDE